MDLRPNARQQELIDLARRLAEEKFAPRAEKYDREASFPFEDYADLREHGLLKLCVPKEHGGLGEGFETYALVAEQLARGNASTALTFNMHSTTMLTMGEWIDGVEMTPEARARHAEVAGRRWREVAEKGVVYGQPHSEMVETGAKDQLHVGGKRFGTTATKVDGGYVINGHKFFVSLSGAADYYATPALLLGDGDWISRTLYLAVPNGAEGVTFSGDWDPLGMRSTVSRNMTLKDVFVPDDAEVVPPGAFGRMYDKLGTTSVSFAPTFLGLMQAAYDYMMKYIKGEIPGSPGLQGEAPARGMAVAEMLFKIEAARSLLYRAVSQVHVGPTLEEMQVARAAHVTVQKTVVEVCAEAIRICGGRATLKTHPLERYYRDARAASVMRPWTQDIATWQAWESAFTGVVGG